ncbi:MAG: phosphoglycolate phosphatase [Acidobacteriaceae bacterium]|jgi:phosphoglycolate phosphatase-like HAD superfamily hydrolase|nr:phosphoglycolate phosphatase [Acidobacteriaceae bacterium]
MSAFATTLSRPWDLFDAYLFDIDGTLICCEDIVHYSAFCEAMQSVAGRPLTLEGVVAHGNTDVGILRDAFTLAGITDDAWRPRLEPIQQAMCRFVHAHERELRVAVLPHVHEVLRHLRSRAAVLGVATGNLHGIGELKLKRAGLLDYFSFGGWSDAFEFRADVFEEAVRKAKALTSENAAVCVVGDTPSDIRAARRNGLPVIAVATGVYPFTQLSGESPDMCLHSLQDLPLR